MNVKIEVELSSSATQTDRDEMYSAAEYITNDEDSIIISVPPNKFDVIIAEFTINKARQIDVVDKIGKEFGYSVKNYSQSSISFPKKLSISRKKSQKNKNKYTDKQGQYLAFIHYYIKLNGYPPAEADMQKYFKTTLPTVHNMILKLVQKGFIERKPNEARSIKLLLSRDVLPDLVGI